MATDPKTAAEALIPLFRFEKILNQDQNGRRLALLGSIHDQPALMTLERAAFPSDASSLKTLLSRIKDITNLGSNDIYRWYMASHGPPQAASSKGTEDVAGSVRAPDLKLNLIYPCTEAHIKKYSPQPVRMVTETPEIYARHVRPYMRQKREEGRLNWVYNILDGKTEQEDVILHEHSRSRDPDATGGGGEEEGDSTGDGFLLLPDLNWDRETVESLRLLALVERRDIWSLRHLKKRHVAWLKHMRQKILKATVEIYGSKGVEEDMLKLYVHCAYNHQSPTAYLLHLLGEEFGHACFVFDLSLTVPSPRPTNLLPSPYPRHERHVGARHHASHGQGIRPREYHFPARIVGGQRGSRHGGCELDVFPRRG